MAMSCFRAPVLLLVYYGLLGSTDVCQGVKVCENDLLPLPLGLEECSTENCRGTCSRGTNPDGYVFDICCADPKTYTCYNRSNLMGIREACFNASSENDTACESFDVNVQCVAELYNKTFEECRWQYLHLYQMVFTTSNGFDPKNCPCETGYTKTNQPCPCTNNTDACGINMGQMEICCFKNSYLEQASPCSSSEQYITLDDDTCSRATCKGRCENMTAYGRTDVQVCCISPDDLLRVDDGSHHPEESSTPAGTTVGGIIAALIAGAIIVVLLVYLRKTGKCARLGLRLKKKRKKREYDDIQMQTRHENVESRDNGTFSDVL